MTHDVRAVMDVAAFPPGQLAQLSIVGGGRRMPTHKDGWGPQTWKHEPAERPVQDLIRWETRV